MAALRDGSPEAGALLDDLYRDSLFRFCWGYVGRTEEAEDAVQDVCFKVLSASDIPDYFRPWLYKVARNHCLNLLRGRAKRKDHHTLPAESQVGEALTGHLTRLARQDEARHVAFGVGHLQHLSAIDPGLRFRLRAAVERRHDALADTAGLNRDVFDALVTLAAGRWTPEAIARGHAKVRRLQAEMDEGRRHRLVRLGFPADEAAELSALHTRNFM